VWTVRIVHSILLEGEGVGPTAKGLL
jgi:hypothetical protein